MALNVIKGMKLNDNTTEFDVAALSNMSLKKISMFTSASGAEEGDPNSSYESKNQLTIGSNLLPTSGSYGLKNTDIRARKSVRLWPGIDDGGTAEIDLMGDGAYFAGVPVSDIKQVHVKALISKEVGNTSKNKTIRLKQSCSELELNNKNCTGTNETTDAAGDFSIKVKHDDEFQNANLKARSIDIRTRTNGIVGGSGGGIALQIASCDSSFKENKLKIETARKVSVFNGLPSSTATVKDFYNTTDNECFEGGSGIEIGTINSQFESIGTAEIRRLAQSSVFACTRSAITAQDDKYDYVTQSDDSKDIKDTLQAPVKFIDLINAAIYLKAKGYIPADGSLYKAATVTYSLTEATAASAKDTALTDGTAAFEVTFTPSSGKTITDANVVVTINGATDSTRTWDTSTNKLTIPATTMTSTVSAVGISITAS